MNKLVLIVVLLAMAVGCNSVIITGYNVDRPMMLGPVQKIKGEPAQEGNDNLYWLVDRNQILAKSTDNGSSWTTLSESAINPSAWAWTAGVDLKIDNTTFYVVYFDRQNQGLHFAKSIDGITWSDTELESFVYYEDSGYGPSLTVDTDHIIITYYSSIKQNLMVIRSTDGGTTWIK